MRLIALFLGILFALPSWADSISYQLTGFGGRQVLVTLSGAQKSTVTASMSSDGLSLRISGVSVSFLANKGQTTPALVSSVQTVQRGAYTDLVINLASPAELTINPGSGDLKLFLTFKGIVKATVAPIESPVDSGVTIAPRKSLLPFRILTSEANPPGPRKVEPGVTILLPESHGTLPESSAAAELRRIAYALDLVWAWASGQELPATNSETSDTEQNQDSQKLEKLIDDLSHELIGLRKELAARNDEIRQLKNSK